MKVRSGFFLPQRQDDQHGSDMFRPIKGNHEGYLQLNHKVGYLSVRTVLPVAAAPLTRLPRSATGEDRAKRERKARELSCAMTAVMSAIKSN